MQNQLLDYILKKIINNICKSSTNINSIESSYLYKEYFSLLCKNENQQKLNFRIEHDQQLFEKYIFFNQNSTIKTINKLIEKRKNNYISKESMILTFFQDIKQIIHSYIFSNKDKLKNIIMFYNTIFERIKLINHLEDTTDKLTIQILYHFRICLINFNLYDEFRENLTPNTYIQNIYLKLSKRNFIYLESLKINSIVLNATVSPHINNFIDFYKIEFILKSFTDKENHLPTLLKILGFEDILEKKELEKHLKEITETNKERLKFFLLSELEIKSLFHYYFLKGNPILNENTFNEKGLDVFFNKNKFNLNFKENFIKSKFLPIDEKEHLKFNLKEIDCLYETLPSDFYKNKEEIIRKIIDETKDIEFLYSFRFLTIEEKIDFLNNFSQFIYLRNKNKYLDLLNYKEELKSNKPLKQNFKI